MPNYRTAKIERLAAAFKALANANRLRIFLRLAACSRSGSHCTAEGDVCECVGEIGKNLKIGLPTVSHHIKELHRAGLIQMQRRGRNVDCWAKPQAMQELSQFFDHSTPGRRKGQDDGRRPQR